MEAQDADHTDLLAQAQSILQKHAQPAGLSAAVASSHPLPYHLLQAGLADIPHSSPVHSEHVFGIGSITKVFLAVVVFQLVEEGKLAYSDCLDEYLAPEVLRDIDIAQGVTIEQLLGHTAGIDSWEDDPVWIRHGRGRDVRPDHIWAKTQPLDYIRRPGQSAPPRGDWYYSNTNYTLLGLIVETVTQGPAEAEIRRRILTPLQLQHTYLEGFEERAQQGTLPQRYHLATDTFRSIAGVCPAFAEISSDLIEARGYNLSVSWLAGGMISSPSDLCTFALALRDGKLLRPASMRVMQQWRQAGDNRECGHGLFRMQLASSPGRWIGHSGGVLGFSAGLWWHEEKDCVICVLGNVGTMHSGNGGPARGVKGVISESDFPSIALKLVGIEESQGS